MQLSNYLFFTVQCEEALSFYTACGLGRVTALLRHGEGDVPLHDEGWRGRILHARFEGPGILFHASDNHDAEPMRGSAHLLEMDGTAETRRLFDRLAEGGLISTPLAIQPWGAFHGKLTDRFGVQWMLSCTPGG